jgi:hypothetical protein
VPRYRVNVSLGLLTTEVESVDEDAAIGDALEQWASEAIEVFAAGTFGVDEIDDE